MKESNPESPASASTREYVTAGLRRSSKYSFHGPSFCLCHSLGRGTLGLTVPVSRLRSPTSQPQPIGPFSLLPVCTTGFGDCRHDRHRRTYGRSYGRQHRQ
ncbi:hypothetical protein ATANTOWER_031360 [Ataeniobius toweri]|uniref:Uncharacterized protein n=1 Tax=Ataeniobius toweri TaxID=208326 RepID=A0ABU7BA16_9TELE|nr:hypothetical protein [Ataeniobius toweri]